MLTVHRDKKKKKKKPCARKVVIRLIAVGTKNLVIEVETVNELPATRPRVFPRELILRRPIKD